jgi:FkbM family methyltransferase
MLSVSGLRQFYKYHKSWRKHKRRQARGRQVPDKQLKFYSQFIRENDLCFDVGANVGDKTEIFLKLGAAVVAVEPQESCWRVLKRRFKNSDKVYVINKALDKSPGSREIFVDRSPTISSMSSEWIDSVKNSGRFSGHRWNSKLEVETTTLDVLVEQFGSPAFCKIDVEGFEFEVLQGLSQPVAVLSLEFIPEYLGPVLDCIEYLSKLGDAKFNYSLADQGDFVIPEWGNADDMVKVLSALAQKSSAQGDVYARFAGTGSDSHSQALETCERKTPVESRYQF